MKKLLLIGTAALLSTTALAQDSKGWWTYEELSAGVKKYEYSRQVLAGKKIELGNWGSMKPDCSPDVMEWKVTKEPEHGTVEFSPSTAQLSYPPDNPRSKCGKTKTILVIYKSNDGYKGEDWFEVTGINAGGFAEEITYRLKVR